jgi:hypothetical protein
MNYASQSTNAGVVQAVLQCTIIVMIAVTVLCTVLPQQLGQPVVAYSSISLRDLVAFK